MPTIWYQPSMILKNVHYAESAHGETNETRIPSHVSTKARELSETSVPAHRKPEELVPRLYGSGGCFSSSPLCLNSQIGSVIITSLNKLQRRRLQNRVSQRAFRQRKEQRLRVLEELLAGWKIKHEKLSEAYCEQSGKLERIRAEAERLLREVDELRRGLCGSDGDEWYFEQWQTASWDQDFGESWHLAGDDNCATSAGGTGANVKSEHGDRCLDPDGATDNAPGDQQL
ncbi:uncharacterized protein AB675_11755 [Cyphellophora attinorum]|uniref:BZIP domain-containing protein n=1 Tax=Cyphellophora attinorum TaxID=1664694 RepID=A0A0N0NJE9_9EURO|nr:uncharacterized protein AB675_11755 [Phialophora attinorum]KPI36828.1 hypothetical protein AB675_11755 [Phialophora attinorum]